ncbi:M48 family metalloprotease [Streptomyces sp. NPDC101112]|uniref:M48 family metalloprotease n=1 Tax=Streptomyces sp. NPDC101112 TaxID=3366105 RepID=UPI003830075F
MYLRALFFWLALTVAAIAIAVPTQSQRQSEASLDRLLCSNRVTGEYLEGLPLTSEEVEIAAASPLWRREFVPDVYQAQVNRAIDRHCGPRTVDRPELRAALTIGVLAGGGILLYWVLPGLGIRCRRLETTGADEPANVVERVVHTLAAEAELPMPTVLVDAADPKVNARAFGNLRRRYIEVTAGFEHKLTKDEDRQFLEAMIRHELGHIQNRDLDVTLAVTALWWVFLALVAGAFGLSLTGYAVGEGSSLRELSLQLVVLIGLVYASRNCFLQSRELHADKFAASCLLAGGERAANTFDDALSELSAAQHRRAPDGSVWPFGTHPSLRRRRAALVHPALADEFTGWEAALLGGLLALSLNLLLGLSFALQTLALRFGILHLSDWDAYPVFVVLVVPFLLLVGPVIALGVRYSVLAWGGINTPGWTLAARLARLAFCLWAGLCIGCLTCSGPLVDAADSPGVLVWQSRASAPVLTLALVSAAIVGLAAVAALGCEAMRMRSGPSTVLLAAYGALLTVTGFPAALPSSAAPLLRGLVLAVLVVSILALLARRRGTCRSPHRRGTHMREKAGSATTMSSPIRAPLLLLCHLVALAMALCALVSVKRLLTDFAPSSTLSLVAGLSLVFHVVGMGSAALATHDGMFRRRGRAAGGCLIAAALAAGLNLTVDGRMTPWLLLVSLGLTAVAFIACEESAAALYDLRHRRRLARDVVSDGPGSDRS